MPPARRARLWVVPLLCLLSGAYAPWDVPTSERRLILDVTFETSKDYDITSAYAVRGWNTTEGSMAIRVPSVAARHGGGYGMEVKVERAFTQNFHAQFSLPHFMPRVPHSLYQLTFWARMVGPPDAMPEVSFMDVDEGYDWVGGANIILSDQWQHIAMEAVATLPKHQMHEIQIAFMVRAWGIRIGAPWCTQSVSASCLPHGCHVAQTALRSYFERLIDACWHHIAH